MVHLRDSLESEIVLVLVNGREHVRKIARILHESHATVLRKLRLLSQKNIVDSVREGRNTVYFIKSTLRARYAIYIAEHYKLSKLFERYPKLAIIFDEVLKKAKGDMIILFGSYASFSAREDSDIDLYIETQDSHLKKNISHVHSTLSVKIGQFELSSLLIKEIIKNHIILRGMERFYEKTRFFD